VRTVVESSNCIFQEIDLDNDIGNDAYIEFTLGENATGCCIAVQIKSGISYVSADRTRFVLRSDQNHFEYWSNHLLPVAAVIFDPVAQRAVWVDVTRHLGEHPRCVTDGPYSISIPATKEFSATRFREFRDHFLSYREEYRQGANFGLALEKFANPEDVEGCLDGIRALFSFHRQRLASWYYLISCFRYFNRHPLLNTLIGVLCHIPGHPDIFWGKWNIIEQSTENAATELIRERFGKDEVIMLLEAVGEGGFQRGTIGQAAHAIIGILKDRTQVLESVAFDAAVPEDARFHALLLLIYYTQHREEDSLLRCLQYIADYAAKFPNESDHQLLIEISEIIRESGGIMLY
jgi:hypothetical protein